MIAVTTAQEETLASALVELAKRRVATGISRADAIKFSNTSIGHAIPRDWYDAPEEIHLDASAKARVRARARLIFGDHGKHGGARKGAGRKPGRNSATRSITLPHASWDKVDKLRGKESRSRFLQRRIQAMRESKKGFLMCRSPKHRKDDS